MRKAHLQFSPDGLIVDGMYLNFNCIAQFLYDMAHPDPRKWYRFERIGDVCIVHLQITTKPTPDDTTELSSASLSSKDDPEA